MREHFRNEGLFRQLFGVVRPLILGGSYALHLIDFLSGTSWIISALGVMIIFNTVQFALRKQPRPVWTHKAFVLCGCSILVTVCASLMLSMTDLVWAQPILPLAQPIILFIAWIIFRPVDTYLKTKIMRRAQSLRSERDDITVIGITGSVGKTTTKELLSHIVGTRAVATPAHVNTEMGVSKWLIHQLEKKETSRIFIVEMGAYRKGEISLLCSIAQPTIGILTYIGTQHIALFGSQEELCKTKGELLASIPENGLSLVNGDNEMCKNTLKKVSSRMVRVGTGGDLDLEAFDIEETPNGIRFKVEDVLMECPLHGTHNVTNILLAIGAAQEIGMSLQEVSKQLKTFTPPSNTFSVREEKGVTILDDTHNASPESFKAGLQWVRQQPFEHTVLLTSGLIELGEAQDRIHAELGTLSSETFKRVIFLHKRSAQSFAKGFGREVEMYREQLVKVHPGTLLVCIGRMSQKKIQSLLP